MEKLLKVAFNDFRLVFRDNSLKIFIVLPLLTLVVVRYAVPYVAGIYPGLQPYVALILMLATTQGATAFGFVYSMVFVDEKDTSVAKVYGILPVSKGWFVVFRLIPPFALAALTSFFLLLIEPFYGLPVIPVVFYSILTGLFAPIMILFVATLAGNKIEAMTWQKIFNLPLVLPILSLFVAAPFSFAFALSPTFWAYQALNSLINAGDFWLYTLFGFTQSLLFLVLMTRRFTRNHFE
ncbi:MAG: hypothetical protein WBO10_09725 [Pyrinomonadaceae bacterium]